MNRDRPADAAPRGGRAGPPAPAAGVAGILAVTGAVARLTGQVETVRDTLASLLITVRCFAFTLAGAGLGLVSLAPVVALLVLPPVLAGLGLFLAALPAMLERQRRYLRCSE